MDILTTSLRDFLTINYDKETIPKEDFLIFLNKQGILFKSPENNDQFYDIISSTNKSNSNGDYVNTKKILDDATKRNTIIQPSIKNDKEIDSNTRIIEKLSKSMEHCGFATKLRTISFDYAFKANTTNSSVDSLIKEADKIFNYLLSDFYSKPNNLDTSSTDK